MVMMIIRFVRDYSEKEMSFYVYSFIMKLLRRLQILELILNNKSPQKSSKQNLYGLEILNQNFQPRIHRKYLQKQSNVNDECHNYHKIVYHKRDTSYSAFESMPNNENISISIFFYFFFLFMTITCNCSIVYQYQNSSRHQFRRKYR